jgi:serine/threonine-protein kinase HipA
MMDADRSVDDHPRNHACIAFAFASKWNLSPAYDLTPSPSVSQRRDLALVCGDMGRLATAKNLRSQRSRFLLSEEVAKAIISKMTDQIRSGRYRALKSQGVSERDANSVKSAFAYEGFEQ